MDAEVESHDTRVLLLHPLLNRPQLVGNSRHISGAYSVLDLAWDAAKNSLRGTAQAVPGDTYTMWIYVPEGMTVARAQAKTQGGQEIPVRYELDGNSLSVSFPGQQGTVDWQVEFAP